MNLLLAATAALSLVSWRSIINPACHGFYRYFGILCIFVLLYRNIAFWFTAMYSPLQLLSWSLLFLALWMVLHSLYLLKNQGGERESEKPKENFAFENTQTIVQSGIFAFIRHPMYTSLGLLATGIMLKQIDLIGLAFCLTSWIMLNISARIEEQENYRFFGAAYTRYMEQTNRFIPWPARTVDKQC